MKPKPAFLFLFLLLGGLASGYAQSPAPNLPPLRWWKEKAVIESLDLKSEQIDRIEAIFRQNTKLIIDQRAETEKMQFDLGLLLEMEPLDKEKILAQADRLEAAKAKLSRLMLSILIDVRNILTLGQWQKFQEMRPTLRNQRQELKRRGENRALPTPAVPKP